MGVYDEISAMRKDGGLWDVITVSASSFTTKSKTRIENQKFASMLTKRDRDYAHFATHD